MRGALAAHGHARRVLLAEIGTAIEVRMEKDLHGSTLRVALLESAREMDGVDLEVFTAGARVPFRIDGVILVCQILELDGAIDQKRIIRGTFQVTARLLVARVRALASS